MNNSTSPTMALFVATIPFTFFSRTILNPITSRLLYSHTQTLQPIIICFCDSYVHAFQYYSIFTESDLDMCCRKSIVCLLDLIVEKHLKQLLYLNLLQLSPQNMVLTSRYENNSLFFPMNHGHGTALTLSRWK